MTEAQKIQNELNAFNAQRIADKKENSVDTSDFPATKRSFTYNKAPAIRAW